MQHQSATLVESGNAHELSVVIRPNASLSARGFAWLMGAFGVISFSLGAFFWSLGAWPVFGFFGLDVLLLYGFFKLNYHRAARYEKIELIDGYLVFSRVTPFGAERSWKFNPHWVRVKLDTHGSDEDDTGSLVLSSHGQYVSLGAFLAPRERASLAAYLTTSLAEYRRLKMH